MVAVIAASSVLRVLLEASREAFRWVDLLSLPWVLQPLVFGVAGVVIMWKRPGNAVGRLLLLPALSWVLDPLVGLKLARVDPDTVRFDPGLYLAILADNLTWLALVFPVFHLLLVYPTGHLLSRKWGWLVAIEVGMIGLLVGLTLGSEIIGPIAENGRGDWTVEVPFGFVSASVFEAAWFGIGWPLGLATLAV